MDEKHLKMESPNMSDENVKKIAALFPNCVTEADDGKGGLKRSINFELLKQMLSPDVVDGAEHYEFTWVGKKKAIVEANKPIRKTLRPCKEESKNWDSTENLYIEGDNLEVLKLLQESYLGKVKMIYIDPPYNTGNDFIYVDDFKRSQEAEDEQMGLFDEDENRLFKNTETNGRFHSDWCSMIYSRLMLARNLLADDGVIFISIDDNEQENLKKCCDEVFGSDNFIAQCVRKRRASQANLSKNISPIHEYLLLYTKQYGDVLKKVKANIEESEFKNPDNDSRGPYKTMPCTNKGGKIYTVTTPTGKVITEEWRFKEDTYNKLLSDNRIVFPRGGDGKPRYKLFLSEKQQEGQLANTWLDSLSSNQDATREISTFFGCLVFDTPKPVGLIKFCAELSTINDSIVLDFFSGSATTAHAVMQLNAEDGGHRKFIMVQLPESCDEKSEAFKAGYKNICEIGKERIRRAGDQILELSIKNLEKEGVIENYARKLSEIRSLEEVYGTGDKRLCVGQETAKGGDVCPVGSNAQSSRVDAVEHCGGAVTRDKRVYPIFESGKGISIGTGDAVVDLRTLELLNSRGYRIKLESLGGNQQNGLFSDSESKLQALSSQFSALRSDIGFRVLKVADSNMKDVYYAAGDYSQDLLAKMESNIKDDRTDLDLLFGCLLDWGLTLSCPYSSEKLDGCTVHTYNDGDLVACFDATIPESVITAIAKRKPLRAVFRDAGFASSPEKINVFEIFKHYAPETSVKVI